MYTVIFKLCIRRNRTSFPDIKVSVNKTVLISSESEKRRCVCASLPMFDRKGMKFEPLYENGLWRHHYCSVYVCP